jgi:hypothetical protein
MNTSSLAFQIRSLLNHVTVNICMVMIFLLHRLATIMKHKNQHSCRYSNGSPRDCLKPDGTCAFRFPVPLHTCTTPHLRAEANRYMYYCPTEQDRFTVPTIPEIALLADAHTNVLKIVPGEWSRYMLKYHTKPPTQDSLKITHEQLALMGMPDADTFELAVAARFAQTRVYAEPELALFATRTPLFTLSTPVHFVNIRKAVLATVITTRTFAGTVYNDLDRYTARPRFCLPDGPHTEDLSCLQFHEKIQSLTKSQAKLMCSEFSPQLHAMAKRAAENCADTYETLNGVINPFPVSSALRSRSLVVSSTGILYLKRPPHIIVRFPRVNPFKDPDAWAFMLLCQYILFGTLTPSQPMAYTYRLPSNMASLTLLKKSLTCCAQTTPNASKVLC